MKAFKLPDKKAPRYRPSRLHLVTPEFVKAFKEKYPEYSELTLSEISNIIKAFNTEIWQTVVNTRDGVELPEQLGCMFIGTCQRPKKDNVDFGTSITLETRVRHRNFESDNYLCKIFYSNYNFRFKDRELWSFKGHRSFTNATSVEYTKNWKRYIMVDNFTKIKDVYKAAAKKYYVLERDTTVSEDYNEFKID